MTEIYGVCSIAVQSHYSFTERTSSLIKIVTSINALLHRIRNYISAGITKQVIITKGFFETSGQQILNTSYTTHELYIRI